MLPRKFSILHTAQAFSASASSMKRIAISRTGSVCSAINPPAAKTSSTIAAHKTPWASWMNIFLIVTIVDGNSQIL
ncbi:MAG: hypothetical protein R2861_16250 [Desulfobacterales bacterium]